MVKSLFMVWMMPQLKVAENAKTNDEMQLRRLVAGLELQGDGEGSAVAAGARHSCSLQSACASRSPIPAHLLIHPSSLPATPTPEQPDSTITTPPL